MTTTVFEDARSFAGAALQEMQKEMRGMEEAIKLCLVALVGDGHVLLEGNPGLGKTSLVKALAGVLQLPWGRIQFTPDLMPADITGTYMPPIPKDKKDGAAADGSHAKASAVGPDLSSGLRLEFQEGPLFTSLLLADEINRATPKTQAAMLEAMAEKQVTVLGERFTLDERNFTPHIVKVNGKDFHIAPQPGRPFMVLATQNPLDYEGTYELPKAQSDRFMFKILMPVPDKQTLMEILQKTTGVLSETSTSPPQPEQFQAKPLRSTPQEVVTRLKEFQAYLMTGVRVQPPLQEHVATIFAASNRQMAGGHELSRLTESFEFGFGPRAARDLVKAAKAWTLLFEGRHDQADGVALAHVVLPALRHRLLLKSGWDEKFREKFRGKYENWEKERLPEAFLLEYCLACWPSKRGIDAHYGDLFKDELIRLIQDRAS